MGVRGEAEKAVMTQEEFQRRELREKLKEFEKQRREVELLMGLMEQELRKMRESIRALMVDTI